MFFQSININTILLLTPSILMYKIQFISFISIFFRTIYISIILTSVLIYNNLIFQLIEFNYNS